MASDKKGAQETGATIVFMDESGFSEHPPVRRTWAPKGKTPILRHHLRWNRLHVIAAIECQADGSDTDALFYMQPQAIDAWSVIRFLEALHAETPGPVTLLWDGLPAHRSRAVKEHVDERWDWLKVEPLPAYAPELNPVEYLLSALKGKDVANLCAVSVDHVARKLEEAANRLGANIGLMQGFLKASTLFEGIG